MLGSERRRGLARSSFNRHGLNCVLVARAVASIARLATDVFSGILVTAATPATTAATAATRIAFPAFACTRRRVGRVDRLRVDKVLRCRRCLVGGWRGTRLALGARATTAALTAFTALTTFSARRTCRLSGWRRVCLCCRFGAGVALIAARATRLRSVAAGFAPTTLAAATVAAAVATAFIRAVSAPVAATATFTATFAALATITASTALG